MTIPGSNLPTLDGKKSYMPIYNISGQTKLFKAQLRTCCLGEFNTTTCQQQCSECAAFGIAVSILQRKHKYTVARIQYREYKIYENDGIYTLNDTRCSDYELKRDNIDIAITPTILAAIKYSRFPLSDTLGAVLVSDMLKQEHALSQAAVTLNEHLQAIDLLSNERYNLDRSHMSVLLHGISKQEKDMHRYINSTYVNVVHNCDKVCTYMMFSNNHDFMTDSDVKQYGLLCMRRLLKVDNKTKTTIDGIDDTKDNSANPYVNVGMLGALVGICSAAFAIFICGRHGLVHNIHNYTRRARLASAGMAGVTREEIASSTTERTHIPKSADAALWQDVNIHMRIDELESDDISDTQKTLIVDSHSYNGCIDSAYKTCSIHTVD